MESTLLALLLAVAISPAALECIDGNCTEPAPFFRVNLQSLFPFFGPVDIDNNENVFDQAIDPLQPPTNASDSSSPQDGVISIHVMEFIQFSDDDVENPADLSFPGLQSNLDKSIDDLGVLDLSGRNLTGNLLVSRLMGRQLFNMPVTSLILSNSQVQDLTVDSFKPVENTLLELRMDNCTSDNLLNALTRLSNLRLLNLSHTGLSTFQWYPQLRDTLEVLDLSHNHLMEVRPELSVLTNLKELYLTHNKISSVDENPLALLPNLEVISLTMNTLNDVDLTTLDNLQQVDLDWNFLWRFGEEVRLPAHRLSLKLASNPWRCDCGMLDARDNYDVLDIDILKCNNHGTYQTCCGDFVRHFLPSEGGKLISNLTKDSIEHLGCTGLSDQFYLFRHALIQIREREPEKVMRLGMLFVCCVFLLLAAIWMCRRLRSKKRFVRPSWMEIKHNPFLNIDKLNKSQEVPYIKIDSPQVKV